MNSLAFALLSSVLLTAPAAAATAALGGPPAVRRVDIEEHPGRSLPDVALLDQDGTPVHLRQYFGDGKPVILVLAYFRCPMLCDLVLRGVMNGMRPTRWKLGRDYRALTVSFDPTDQPDEALRRQELLLQALGQPQSGRDWPFLTGKEAAVQALAKAVGFDYVYDPKSKMYAHPACAIVLTPDGRVSRYLYGVKFRPLDLRAALTEASGGKVGGIFDRVILCCFHYDPATRRYGVYVAGMLRGGAAVILLAVAGFIAFVRRLERRRRNS